MCHVIFLFPPKTTFSVRNVFKYFLTVQSKMATSAWVLGTNSRAGHLANTEPALTFDLPASASCLLVGCLLVEKISKQGHWAG